jgi:hypothetical protein
MRRVSGAARAFLSDETQGAARVRDNQTGRIRRGRESGQVSRLIAHFPQVDVPISAHFLGERVILSDEATDERPLPTGDCRTRRAGDKGVWERRASAKKSYGE